MSTKASCPYARLAARMLQYAVLDAQYGIATTTDTDAASARFWLRFGQGASIAELLGREVALKKFLAALPPLPGQNGALPVLELARLMEDADK